MTSIYSQEFLHYFKNPQFKLKNIDKFSFKGKSKNLSCGDSIEFGFDLDKDDNLNNINYSGVGCVVSLASAEFLSDKFFNKDLNELLSYSQKDFFQDLGFELTPSRQKCALISFNALKNALENYEKSKN